MCRLLLSCDEYVYKYNDCYYAANQEKYDFFMRYTRIFDHVRCAIRCIDEQELKANRVLLNHKSIEIWPIPIFHGPKEFIINYNKVVNSIDGVENDCDAAVLRLPSTVAQMIYDHVKKQRIPYATEIVYDAHDGAVSSVKWIEKLLWYGIDYKMRRICYGADGVAPVTEFYLQKRYYSKKKDSFKSHYSSLALDKSFYSGPRAYPNKEIFSIVHVANHIGLHDRKGTTELMQAVKKVIDNGYTVTVNYVGADWDNSEKKIKEYARQIGLEGQVKCIGFLNKDQLSDFLCSSDIFVLPTRAEGLPRVLIEALAKGLPCITTPVSGNPELVNSDFLIDYNDIDGLANKIIDLITCKSVYENASKNNFQKSLLYEASILQDRRDTFYSKLKEKIRTNAK